MLESYKNESRDIMKQFSYIDIFAGCGGLSLGLYNAGWEGLFAIEKSKDAFATLKYNLIDKRKHFCWNEWLPQTEHDINEVIKTYKEELKKLQGKVNLVVGGPPCQGFSMAGQRKKNDIRNKLSESYIEFISIVKPKILIFENVQGFTIGFKDEDDRKGIPFSKILKEKLEKLGYSVEGKMVDISEFGVPQKRNRFIMVGVLEGSPHVFFELLYNNKKIFLEKKGLREQISVKEAIGDLLKENGTVPTPDFKNYESGVYGEITSNYQELMRKAIESVTGTVADSHRFAKHSEETVKINKEMLKKCPKLKRVTPKDNLVKNLRKRGVTVLDENKGAPTVTAHPDDFVHYSEPRILTVRESARIQSFPDDFEFKGKYTTGGQLRKIEVPRCTQVGNVVPPLFAEQVGLALKEMINSESAKSKLSTV